MISRLAKNIVSLASRFLVGIILIGLTTVLVINHVMAADYIRLPNRSLTIDDTTPGAVTTYTLRWSYPSSTTIGSIRFALCTDGFTLDTCTAPPGDLSAAVLSSQTGVTGFSILSQTANEIILSRGPAAGSNIDSSYTFTNVTNPSGLPAKFFIRIYTYASGDGTGTPNEISSVVSATTQPITINTEVPPILYFCAGITVTDYCASVVGNQIDYGTLSSLTADTATSQFGVATNAPGGYIVTTNGNTMTSGIKTIPALNAQDFNMPGTGQFGINLRANTDPAVGADVAGEGWGIVDGDYDDPDQFQFINGDIVATALTGTLFNTYTVTYVVNVPPDQPAGVYSTTIAYICTAAF